MEKKFVILLSVLLIIFVTAIFYPSSQDVSPIIGLAIAEEKTISMARYDKIRIESENDAYLLRLSGLGWSRDYADFILTADPKSSAPYLQRYFRLDFDRVRTTMYNNPNIIYTQPQKSITINLDNGKQIYVELVSIESRTAKIIVKLTK
jgi:hypothetical protein